MRSPLTKTDWSFILTVLILLFSSIPAFSEPVIEGLEGAAFPGNSITVRGTGFGNNGPEIIVFDDFEAGSTGEPIKTGSGSAAYGEWDMVAGGPYYTDSSSVSGSLAMQSDQSVHWNVLAGVYLPAGTTQVFVSWWLYLPAGDNFPGEPIQDTNWKQMWITGQDTTDDDLVVPTLLSSDGSAWFINGNDSPYAHWITMPFVKGEWKHLWSWVNGGYAGDGQVHFWESGVSPVVTHVYDNNVTVLDTGGFFERVLVNGYGRVTSNCHPTFDDVYIAAGPYARARVEIGNQPVYNQCTKLAISTPTSWSNTQIVFSLKAGGFSSGETVYLFVTDANGEISTGVPLIISSADDSISPSPPSSLRIY